MTLARLKNLAFGNHKPLAGLTLVVVAFSVLILPIFRTLAAPPGNPSFQRTWERPDKAVADGLIDRTWMWGPAGFTGQLKEPYADSPDGERSVQYFDKSRMEITDPYADSNSDWYVTNGLLVVELITGRMQVGDNAFQQRLPAQVNVAGDADDSTGPTYQSFQAVLDYPARNEGEYITERIDRNGNVTNDASLTAQNVTASHYTDETKHTVAGPFWTFMNSQGLVYRDGQYLTDKIFPNAYYATGLPVSEAYWAEVKVGGSYQDVLMQCFERRCLTYTPGNSPGWQVEAGNVGLHYYTWRYDQPSGDPTPEPSPTVEPSPTADPSATPDPSQTPVPSPTAEQSPTPDPSPTPEPTPDSVVRDYVYAGAWDNQAIETSAFKEPFGIAVSPSGDIYVSEIGEGEDDVQRFTPDGVLVTGWGSFGAEAGQFDDAVGLAIDADGYVYVADHGNDRLQKFDQYGAYVSTLADDAILNGPMDVAINQDAGYAYVVDSFNHRIVRLTLGKTGEPPTFGSQGSGNGQFSYPNGIALDASGNVYVADTGNRRIQKFSLSGEWIASFGSNGTGQDQFIRPRDVVVGTDGRVYVVDTGDQDNGAAIKVWEPLNEEGTEYGFAFSWDKSKADPSNFDYPPRIAMDRDGNIYVAELGNNRIQKFTSEGVFVDVWTDASRNAFEHPLEVTYAGGYLYAVDEELHQVKVFTTEGGFVRQWDEYLQGPIDVAVSGEYVYVADQAQDKIVKFSSSGEYLKSWGEYGHDPGQFARFEGIAVDGDGYVYVVDSDNYRIQKFTSEGDYVKSWGSYGTGPGQFESSTDIAIYGDKLYVVDFYPARVQQFDLDGNYVREFGEEGDAPGQLSGASAVTVDEYGYIYVADRDNHRVQKFNVDGEYVAILSYETTGMPEYSSPIGVAVSGGDTVYVVSELLNGIMIFEPAQPN